ncbi:putative zinc finger CCHC-type and RNA-binding motif-containing protein 1-like [Capsicum annuum]|nr:putative zinc finger CCHC-type and RNA-binding motif-containing protein 1-like [Capsicum annuum]
MKTKKKNVRKLANNSSSCARKILNKNSIAIKNLEANLFNQIVINNGEEATQKMDVDGVRDTLGDVDTLLLWNPSTRESIVLPPLESPPASVSRYGLGYDSTSGEYKILHICRGFDNKKLANEILTLKCGSWRRIDEHPHGICSLMSAMQFLAFIQATFHWIAVSVDYFVVVSFSILNEVYGEISLSEEILSLRPGPRGIGVCVLGGMLCVHSNTFLQGKIIFKVWVLKEYEVEGSWMPLLTIEDSRFLNVKPKYRFAYGEVLFRCMSSQPTSGHAFRTCNGPFRSSPRTDTIQDGYTFMKSLISPKSLTY